MISKTIIFVFINLVILALILMNGFTVNFYIGCSIVLHSGFYY
jgi:hypothetical protein